MKDPLPKFGTIRETRELDDIGSKVTTERKYVNSSINYPVRRFYEYRIKVHSKKEEMTEYIRFTDSLDESRVDPSWRIEQTIHGKANGYYFIVKNYTTLEYDHLAQAK